LALDEFFVTDVGTAMILSRLFGRLWDRGVVLIATSNCHPDVLYAGGLQRPLFVPFIHRLKVCASVITGPARLWWVVLLPYHLPTCGVAHTSLLAHSVDPSLSPSMSMRL
jgi:hypothetical protein